MIQIRPTLWIAALDGKDFDAKTPPPVSNAVYVYVGATWPEKRNKDKIIRSAMPPIPVHRTIGGYDADDDRQLVQDDANWRPHGSDAKGAELIDRGVEFVVATIRQGTPVVVFDKSGITLAPLVAGLALCQLESAPPDHVLSILQERVGPRVLANPCMKLWLLHRKCRDFDCPKACGGAQIDLTQRQPREGESGPAGDRHRIEREEAL